MEKLVKLLLLISTAIRRVFRIKPQTYRLEYVVPQSASDMGTGIIRLPNKAILTEAQPDGIVERDNYVKILNPENGMWTVGYARGSGGIYSDPERTTFGNGRESSRPIRTIGFAGCGLDYDASLQLGITKSRGLVKDVDLVACKATWLEVEYFHLAIDPDRGARAGRKQNWVLYVLGLWLTFLSAVTKLF